MNIATMGLVLRVLIREFSISASCFVPRGIDFVVVFSFKTSISPLQINKNTPSIEMSFLPLISRQNEARASAKETNVANLKRTTRSQRSRSKSPAAPRSKSPMVKTSDSPIISKSTPAETQRSPLPASKNTHSQKHKQELASLPQWVRVWAMIASALVTFDCIYVFSLAYGSYVPSTVRQLWSWYGTSDTQYSSKGLIDSNGWILTQSKFNVIEVACQILFLWVLPRDSPEGLVTIAFASICTLWKTLLYMSIIIHSADPVHMVPLLACFGYSAVGQKHIDEVNQSLKDDSCGMQFFKFQFNFWWILVPAIVTYLSFERIMNAFHVAESKDSSD